MVEALGPGIPFIEVSSDNLDVTLSLHLPLEESREFGAQLESQHRCTGDGQRKRQLPGPGTELENGTPRPHAGNFEEILE